MEKKSIPQSKVNFNTPAIIKSLFWQTWFKVGVETSFLDVPVHLQRSTEVDRACNNKNLLSKIKLLSWESIKNFQTLRQYQFHSASPGSSHQVNPFNFPASQCHLGLFYQTPLNRSLVTDMEFVQKFTPPDFKVKNFTPSISPYFNSFSGKKHKKCVKM